MSDFIYNDSKYKFLHKAELKVYTKPLIYFEK